MFVLTKIIRCVAIIFFSAPQLWRLVGYWCFLEETSKKHTEIFRLNILDCLLKIYANIAQKIIVRMNTINWGWLSRIVLTVTALLCVVFTIISSPKVPKQMVDIKECLTQQIPIPHVAQECTRPMYHPGYLEHICKQDQ